MRQNGIFAASPMEPAVGIHHGQASGHEIGTKLGGTGIDHTVHHPLGCHAMEEMDGVQGFLITYQLNAGEIIIEHLVA